jgi:hypothetical protein
MTLHVGVNTYLSVENSDAYFAARNISAWADATSSARAAALLKATAYLDVAFRFHGAIADLAQDLAWPRHGVIDRDGRAVSGIPKQVEAATAELALIALLGDLAPQLDVNGRIISERIGSLELRYQSTTADRMRYPFVTMLLRDLIVGGGNASLVSQKMIRQ